MLLRFFRINDPYRLLGLMAILPLLSLPLFIFPVQSTLQELSGFLVGEAVHTGKWMYDEVFDSTGPLTGLIYGALDVLWGRSATGQHILALILLIFQASFFGILLIDNKAYNDSTYVPSFIFGLLCLFSFDLVTFSPELLGSTVLLLALDNLFKEIEFRVDRDETILNLGLYLGIASLLIFSYSIYLIATVLILFLYTRINARKLLLLLFGFLLPHMILFTIYYVRGKTWALIENFYLPNLSSAPAHLIDFRSLLVLGAIPAIYFVLSLFMLNREARFTKYQSQLFQVMFQWLLVGVVQVFISRQLTPHSLLIFIPSLAYFVSHYLLLIRRKWIAELMLWIFLGGVVSTSYLARTNRIAMVHYDGLFPKIEAAKRWEGLKVMVLKHDAGVFARNAMAGPFLDWSLSKGVLENPEYYENVITVARIFETDPPDVILDPGDLMSQYFQKIPGWSKQYRREGDLYVREQRVSN